MTTVEQIQFAMMFITAWALFYGIYKFRLQLQLNFFADYTKRYQEILLNFPEEINRDDFDFGKLEKEKRDKTLRYMRAYFDLCSEEYYLWRNGNIEKKTWKEWESGIKFAFSKTAFKEAWKILRLDTVYYGKFTKFVEDAVSKVHTRNAI